MDTQRKNKAVCILFALLLLAGFLLCAFFPKETYSASERRRLAVCPQLSVDGVWSGRFMSGFEDYATDTFPFRDVFRRGKALTAAGIFQRKDNHGVYVADGFLLSMEYPLNVDSLDRAAERFAYICEKYLTKENHVYLSVIPDKNCFLAPESGHLFLDYGELERQMREKTSFAEYIRISDLLEKEDYYRTDSHWRQERITDVADRLARQMGAELSADYKLHTLEQDFYGTYYGQAALPFNPDTLQYLTGEAIDHCRVYDWQNEREIPVYDLEKADGRDPYEMFLSGSLSLVTIENTRAKNGRELVIFRDSFGSSIAPLLLGGYSRITLIDIRYIHPDQLGRWVDFTSCDVLFLYSTLTLNHSETLK